MGTGGANALTVIAMVTSLIIWYIVNGNPAGVIVFMALFSFAETYFIVAYPKLTIVALLSIVTQGTAPPPRLSAYADRYSLDCRVRARSEESRRKGM